MVERRQTAGITCAVHRSSRCRASGPSRSASSDSKPARSACRPWRVAAGGIGQWLTDGVNGVAVPPPADERSFGDALAGVLADRNRLAALRDRGASGGSEQDRRGARRSARSRVSVHRGPRAGHDMLIGLTALRRRRRARCAGSSGLRKRLPRLAGIEAVNVQFQSRTAGDTRRASRRCLCCRRTRWSIAGPGRRRKPMTRELFDVLAETASARGHEHFCYINSDIVVLPAAFEAIARTVAPDAARSRVTTSTTRRSARAPCRSPRASTCSWCRWRGGGVTPTDSVLTSSATPAGTTCTRPS